MGIDLRMAYDITLLWCLTAMILQTCTPCGVPPECKLRPDLSFLNMDVTNWNTSYLIRGLTTLGQPANSTRLVSSTKGQSGSIWLKNAINMRDFFIQVSVQIGKDDVDNGDGAAFLFANQLFMGGDYTVKWQNFSGLSIFASPYFNALYGGLFDSPVLQSNHPMQGSLFDDRTANDLQLANVTYEIRVSQASDSENQTLSVAYARNKTCHISAANISLPRPVFSLVNGIKFGIGAYCGSATDSVDLFDVAVYDCAKNTTPAATKAATTTTSKLTTKLQKNETTTTASIASSTKPNFPIITGRSSTNSQKPNSLVSSVKSTLLSLSTKVVTTVIPSGPNTVLGTTARNNPENGSYTVAEFDGRLHYSDNITLPSGKVILSTGEWNFDLSNSSSPTFKELAAYLKPPIMELYVGYESVEVAVKGFKRGSIISDYAVTLRTLTDMSEDEIQRKVDAMLESLRHLGTSPKTGFPWGPTEKVAMSNYKKSVSKSFSTRNKALAVLHFVALMAGIHFPNL